MPVKKIIIAFTLAMAVSLLPFFNAAAKIDLVTLQDRIFVETTIYNKADLTLVRDKRVLNFVKGMNRLQFSWANTKIDPTSLSLDIKENTDKIDVVEITYPQGTRDVGIWLIKAKQPCRAQVEITYFTSGISWESYYLALLSKDQKTCGLKGYVKVTNYSGEDYNNARTRLVVGKINILDKIAMLSSRQYPYGTPEYFAGKTRIKNVYEKGIRELDYARPVMAMALTKKKSGLKNIKKQGLSEYFLYTIEGKETIPDGWAKRLLSFKAENIRVKNIYKYEYERFGQNVVRFLTFKNNKENNLGKTPMPGGEIKVFQSIGKKGELDFIGADSTKYIPIGKKIELNLGPTLNVKIVPRIMAYRKKNIIFDTKGNMSGFDEVKDFELKLSNFTSAASTIEYVKNLRSSHFKITKMTHPDKFEKKDQDTIRFKIELPPHSNKSIRFTLTTLRGERRWQK
ncbi:MAG: DUF4139 domain-containing protein [Deltaproteobacteria bacterium]|nr:DUF4139 domain-containing protein [Deltaproteobacteria bacterium]